MRDIKIGALHLNAARNSQKRSCLSEFIKIKRIDVTFIQESQRTEWDAQVFMSHMSSNSGGVALLLSQQFSPILCGEKEIDKGRLLQTKAKLENILMTFYNIYAPTKADERIDFSNAFVAVLKDIKSEEFFILTAQRMRREIQITQKHILLH